MQTILLKEIKDHKGRIITDHLWFNYTKGFQKLNLREGVCVQFDARVKPYLKGYARAYGEQEIDYKLSHPTKTTNPTKNNHKPHTTHKNTPKKTKNFKILKKPPRKKWKKIVEKKGEPKMNQNKNELIETLLEEIEQLKGRINGIEADIQYETIREENIRRK